MNWISLKNPRNWKFQTSSITFKVHSTENNAKATFQLKTIEPFSLFEKIFENKIFIEKVNAFLFLKSTAKLEMEEKSAITSKRAKCSSNRITGRNWLEISIAADFLSDFSLNTFYSKASDARFTTEAKPRVTWELFRGCERKMNIPH